MQNLADNLPVLSELTRLADGDGLECTFIQIHAINHKSCSLKYNDTHLQRATKRKSTEDIFVIPDRFTRRRTSQPDHPNIVCVSSVTNQERRLINFAMHLLAI